MILRRRWTTLLIQLLALIGLTVIEVIERGVQFIDNWGSSRKENIWSMVVLFLVLFVAAWFTI